jgi:hypothetical protein
MSVRHKHLKIDKTKIDKERRALGARTEQETVDRALDLVIAGAPSLRAYRAIRRTGVIVDLFARP